MDTPYGLFKFTPNNLSCYISYQTNTFLANIKRKPQITYLCNYLNEFKKNSHNIYFIYENNYIDQHYIEDYSSYYARCFKNYKKNCSRIHFFKSKKPLETCKKEFKKALDGDKKTFITNQNYLGYIVIRPIPETFLAKVCLIPYYLTGNNRNRKFIITKSYKISLFGINLFVKSVAYQEQDRIVSACATTSLWSFFHAHPRKNLMELPSSSLITKGAYTDYDSLEREFPNSGLSIQMICSSLKENGFAPEYFQFLEDSETKELQSKNTYQKERFNLFKEYIHTYCSSGIPLILGVSIKDYETSEFKGLHAVTVVGYSMNSKQINSNLIAHNIDKIYVHDDRIGPFLRINLKEDTFEVELEINEDVSKQINYSKEIYSPDTLIIGVYHKIRISYANIKNTVLTLMDLFDKYLIDTKMEDISDIVKEFKWDIQIKQNAHFKADILRNTQISNKTVYLTNSLPKYIWSATAIFENTKIIEMIFDATDLAQGDVFLDFIPLNQEYGEYFLDYIRKYCIEIFNFNPNDKTSNSSFLGILKYFRKQDSNQETLRNLFGYLKIPLEIKRQEIKNDSIINSCKIRLNQENKSDFYLDKNLNEQYQYIWVIDKDGFLCIGIESNTRLGHPTLTNGMPARIGGELKYNNIHSHWEINYFSGRYSSDYSKDEKDFYLKNTLNHKFCLYFPNEKFKITP